MFLKISIIEGLHTKECDVLKLKTCCTLTESHVVGYLSTFCFNDLKPFHQVVEPVAHVSSVQLNSSKFTTWIRVCNNNSPCFVLCWRPRLLCLLTCIIEAAISLKAKKKKKMHLYLILISSWRAKTAWNISNKQNNMQSDAYELTRRNSIFCAVV